MASKKFKNKTCAYCGEPGASATGDHVFARQFFLVKHRGDDAPNASARALVVHWISSRSRRPRIALESDLDERDVMARERG
jgi:5-methylcytosine-specific restriction endonuclease McrA